MPERESKLTRSGHDTGLDLRLDKRTMQAPNSYLKKAIEFSLQVHKNQTRKGNGMPYITHPFTVGMMLARAGAPEEIIAAGMLHDTIEDSEPESKVSREMLEQDFGPRVAEIVTNLSEDKSLPWHERKRQAREELQHLDHDTLLVKSADAISNVNDLIDDYGRDGEAMFSKFNSTKEDLLGHFKAILSGLIAHWPENPFMHDLQFTE